MKVHIHGNCQSYVLATMLADIFPHWKITSSQVHADEVLEQNEVYRQNVHDADLVLTQPIHTGYRGRDDLSLDWIRNAVRDDAMTLVYPSMHFTGHHPTDADLEMPPLVTGDSLVATLVAGGLRPETVSEILTSPDLLSEQVIQQELAHSIAEMARREADDGIDIVLSPFLAENAELGQLFHFVNHPYRIVYVHMLNQFLARLGFSRRVQADGADWQEALHIPPVPAIQSYLARTAGVQVARAGRDGGAMVLIPHQGPMTQPRYFRAMAERLAECPAADLLAAVNKRVWPRDFLGRFAASFAMIPSPGADGLTPGERIEAAQKLARTLQSLAHRELIPMAALEGNTVDANDPTTVSFEPADPAGPLFADVRRAASIPAARSPSPRWSPDLAERLLREATDRIHGELQSRLRGALLAAGTGEQAAARRELEAILQDFPQTSRSNQWFLDNYLLACLPAGAFDLASAVIREHASCPWSAEIAIADTGVPGPVMRWEVLNEGRSRFVFQPAIFEGDAVLGVVLSWARSMALYDGYHRSGQLELGTTNVNLFDGGLAPGLAFCDNRSDTFLVPDPEYLHLEGYKQLRAEFDQSLPDWDARDTSALWRGSTTGVWDGVNWRTLARARLCELAGTSGGLIDAGITSVSQMPDHIVEEIRASGLVRTSVPPLEFARRKYQIDIDGNTNSWPGLFHKLYSGSVVLKIQSSQGYRQWYYDRLVPWYNYVPVSADMSDLLVKLRWLQANDAAAREIGRRGRELAASLDHEGEVMGAAPAIAAALRQDAFLRSG